MSSVGGEPGPSPHPRFARPADRTSGTATCGHGPSRPSARFATAWTAASGSETAIHGRPGSRTRSRPPFTIFAMPSAPSQRKASRRAGFLMMARPKSGTAGYAPCWPCHRSRPSSGCWVSRTGWASCAPPALSARRGGRHVGRGVTPATATDAGRCWRRRSTTGSRPTRFRTSASPGGRVILSSIHLGPSGPTGCFPDGTYVECAGMLESKDYAEKIARKQQLARAVGLPLIVVGPTDMHRLGQIFGRQLESGQPT